MTTTTDSDTLDLGGIRLTRSPGGNVDVRTPTTAVAMTVRAADIADIIKFLSESVEPAYEYCVMHPDYPGDPHRGPMSEQDAGEWVTMVNEADDDRPFDFYVARRSVGPWERV